MSFLLKTGCKWSVKMSCEQSAWLSGVSFTWIISLKEPNCTKIINEHLYCLCMPFETASLVHLKDMIVVKLTCLLSGVRICILDVGQLWLFLVANTPFTTNDKLSPKTNCSMHIPACWKLFQDCPQSIIYF